MSNKRFTIGQEIEFDSPYVSSKITKKGTISKLSTRNHLMHKDEIEVVAYNTLLKRNCIVTVSPRYIK